MKHSKQFLVTTGLTALIITISVAFFTIHQKPDDKPNLSAGMAKVAAIDSVWVRPLTNVTYERTEQRRTRGKYLSEGLLQCFTCHSPRNWDVPGAPPMDGMYGSGGTILHEDSSHRIIAPNITPDKETGAGTWTDDMLARAIREGIGHDGRVLYWDMPSTTFRYLSDEDLASVVVYLRAMPPIHHSVPPTKFPAEEGAEMEKYLRPITEPVLAPDLSDSIELGRYLVRVGECMGCHTSHSEYNPGLFGGGNYIERFGLHSFSANITNDPAGIGYGQAGFLFVMHTGKSGTLSPIMPWIAFKNMNDEDMKAMYAYLSTFSPAQHYISNQPPFTHCAICGQEHGLGETNKVIKPTGIQLNPNLYREISG